MIVRIRWALNAQSTMSLTAAVITPLPRTPGCAPNAISPMPAPLLPTLIEPPKRPGPDPPSASIAKPQSLPFSQAPARRWMKSAAWSRV